MTRTDHANSDSVANKQDTRTTAAPTDPQDAAARRATDPNVIQQRASDPASSVWMSASAGSGKTKVLVDRLLRLFLPDQDGHGATPPHRILCLTFTKAGASEMAIRINKVLGEWAIAADTDLQKALRSLLGYAPTDQQKMIARHLFAKVLDAPGGLKITTIHAFCQSVLSRFPLEAGLTPNFDPIDENEAARLIEQARDQILDEARTGQNPHMADIVMRLLHSQQEDTLMKELGNLTGERLQMAKLAHRRDHWADILATQIGIAPDLDEAQLTRTVCDDTAFDKHGLYEACTCLAGLPQKTSKTNAVLIQDWLDSTPAARADMLDDYMYKVYIAKSTGNMNKNLLNKTIQNQHPHIGDILEREADRLLTFIDQRLKIRLFRNTLDFLTLGLAVLERYQDIKESRAILDYDDMIIRTLHLLNTRDISPWVMYKLDGGIDHILVDESQDTNPEQWEIIDLLTDEFFSGQSAADERDDPVDRSLFVVGDKKQSIFSFQRAAPHLFDEKRAYFEEKAQHAGKKWRNEPINTSFRSVSSVLRLVDTVFSDESVLKGVENTILTHDSFRTRKDGAAGLCELWPLFKRDQDAEKQRKQAAKNEKWPLPITIEDTPSPQNQLASYIADRIADWIDRGEILKSRGTPITADDIMILVRSRSDIVTQISRALRLKNIPVSGLDRMVIGDQLPVMDLLACARFALLPDDDLSLACVLKSPLINFDDNQLMDLAIDRGTDSLWQRVKATAPAAVTRYLKALIAAGAREKPYEFFSFILQTPCPADYTVRPHDAADAPNNNDRDDNNGNDAATATQPNAPTNTPARDTAAAKSRTEAQKPLTGLYALERRLGNDIFDPLEEFLNLTLQYEEEHIPHLQAFLIWQKSSDQTIKREMEEAGGEVRIMTVHGSKGLQAPIVILPDTIRVSQSQKKQRLLWPDKTGLDMPLWAANSDSEDNLFATHSAALKERDNEEYRRLLYVAMTRAEDRLYIGGAQKDKPIADSWYYYIQSGFEKCDDAVKVPFHQPHKNVSHSDTVADDTNDEDTPHALRIYNTRTQPPKHKAPASPTAKTAHDGQDGYDGKHDDGHDNEHDDGRNTATADTNAATLRLHPDDHIDLPPYLLEPPPPEHDPPRPLIPSRPSESEPAARSPLQSTEDRRFLRGNVTHSLLQILPDIDEGHRAQAIRTYVSRPAFAFSQDVQDSITAEVLDILHHPDYAVLFGPKSMAEVPITGLIDGKLMTGQIDRLYVDDDIVKIVDYKSNRPSPTQIEDVPAQYIKQMASYRSAISDIYPNRAIETYLLWTDTARIMRVEAG